MIDYLILDKKIILKRSCFKVMNFLIFRDFLDFFIFLEFFLDLFSI